MPLWLVNILVVFDISCLLSCRTDRLKKKGFQENAEKRDIIFTFYV